MLNHRCGHEVDLQFVNSNVMQKQGVTKLIVKCQKFAHLSVTKGACNQLTEHLCNRNRTSCTNGLSVGVPVAPIVDELVPAESR